MILRYIQRAWSASGDFCQAQWNSILDTIGDDPMTLWVYGSIIYTFVVYWIVGGIFTFFDVTNRPAVIRRYKIQPGTNEPVDRKELLQASALVIFNQLIVGLPISYASYFLMQWRFGCFPLRELPTFRQIIAEILVHIVCIEISFYYPHRLLHSPLLYKYIHKRHHEWKSCISITAFYCHPLEHITSDLIPPIFGVILLGSHIVTAWIWFTLAIITTLNHHSGYHLPFALSSEMHDFHHLKFRQNYGIFGVLDRLHGTNAKFRKTNGYTRHRIIFSLTPASEVFPDK